MARIPCLPCAIAALLAACSNLTDEVSVAVEESLAGRSNISVQAMQSYPGNVVCGSYSAEVPGSYGPTTAPFVYVQGVVVLSPDDDQRTIFCSEQQGARLFERLGIGPWEDPAAKLPTLLKDLLRLEAALSAYVDDHGDLPLRGGLAALVPPHGDYLDELPQDPWGRDYRFEAGLGGRVVRSYTLRTLGADGRPGGRGPDADVGRRHLLYLELLAATAS